jgi:hypothetical protein
MVRSGRKNLKTSQRSATLRELFSGGDRRSVARSKQAQTIVEDSPDRIEELVTLVSDMDWLVSMRAVDLLEKLAHQRVEWVQPHKRIFIGPLADRGEWEIRLQVVRALPLFKWTPREKERVLDILVRDVNHPKKFVSAWALDSLARFAEDDSSLMPTVRRALASFEKSESKALRTRARHIRTRLKAAGAL